jgi:hypothetical protein
MFKKKPLKKPIEELKPVKKVFEEVLNETAKRRVFVSAANLLHPDRAKSAGITFVHVNGPEHSTGRIAGLPTDPPFVAQRKNELLMYVQSFYRRSWDWRSQRFHAKWDRNDRDYNSIYDPASAASKKRTLAGKDTYRPYCPEHRSDSFQIYKTMMAPKPCVQTQAGPAGDALQARLMQDVVADQFQKAKFEVGFYDTSKEAVKYGSGL